MIYLILTSREENSDYALVIINKSDYKDFSEKDKKENLADCQSTQKTTFTNSNELITGKNSDANNLETQNLNKDDKQDSKNNKNEKENFNSNLFSNVISLRNTEKNILENFNVSKNNYNNNISSSICENIHNTSSNSHDNSKQDNNKSHSNCECYSKRYFNITDVSNSESNNKNKMSEKNQALQVWKINKENDNNLNINQKENNLAIKKTNKNNFFNQDNTNNNKSNFYNNNKESEIYNYPTEEDQKNLLPKKKEFDIEKLNRFKHIYIKNLYLKLNSNQSLLTLFVKGFLKATAKPWEMLLDLFMPKSNEGAYLIIKFIIPLFFIWNFSEVELFILEKVMSRLKVPASFLGLTIMSWGNNAPDMYNVASAMAKGLVDLALNAAIASEIHNILLGLGLPWLVYNLTYAKPIEFQMNDLYAFTIFFFCVFLLVFLLALKFNRNRFDYKLAVFLILVYLVFLILIFVFSFNIKLW